MSNLNSRLLRSAAGAVCLLLCGFCVAQEPAPEPGQPAQNSPTQTAPAETSPAQTSPVPTSPAQNAPAQTSPIPTSPAPRLQTPLPGELLPNAPLLDEVQPKRIMGMMPNFRSVTAGQVVPKETWRGKLLTSSEDNFDYSSLFFAGFIAADSFLAKSTPEFHQGAAGFARYYWHTVADQSIENYFVELIVPSITHEDSRYYAMGREGGGFWKRSGYSLSRVVVTKTDAGKSTFNYSEIAGSATAASISIFYYPTQQHTVSNVMQNWGLDITYDAVTFMFHEFWPDISHSIFRKKVRVATATP